MTNKSKNRYFLTSVSRRDMLAGTAGAVAVQLVSKSSQAQSPEYPSFDLKFNQISVEGTKLVVIVNPDVTKLFKDHPIDLTRALGEKSRLAFTLDPKTIALNANGEVIINDPVFAAKMKAAASSADGDTNYCCGCNAYKCQ